MLTDLERITILAYADTGDTPHVILCPDYFAAAQRTVRRLLQCGLDPADVLYPAMSARERQQIFALCTRLRHYVALGHVTVLHPPESTT